MSKKSINFHFITDNDFIGYGMASKNMLDAFNCIKNSEITQVKPGGKGKVFSKDFFIRPPPWITSSSKKKIAYFYWETDRLPKPWAASLRTADEIWAPCELVRDVCIQAGYRGQIRLVPTPYKKWDINFSGQINHPSINSDTYKFYSIFQWHTRKGWRELLESYWTEFSKPSDNVALILKVNSIHGSPGNYLIKKDIDDLKKDLNLSFYPKVYLIDSILPREHIAALHEYCDCYIAPHHGEGWGMPIHDAIVAKKNIITTKYGGVTEFLNNSNANIIDHKIGPVKDMEWNAAYEPGQNWAYPEVEHIKVLMRDVFENRYDEKFLIKRSLLSSIEKNTSIENISNIISSFI